MIGLGIISRVDPFSKLYSTQMLSCATFSLPKINDVIFTEFFFPEPLITPLQILYQLAK